MGGERLEVEGVRGGRGGRWVVGGESICAYAVTVLDKNGCPFLFLGLGEI